MKESGECPKCEGRNIWNNSHFGLKVVGAKYIRRWIMVRMSGWPHRRKLAFKDEYVCLDCGYTEAYVDKVGIKRIKEFGIPEDT